MDPIIGAILIAVVIMRWWDHMRGEYAHTKNNARDQLKKDNPDRSDRWLDRHARRRALTQWGAEARHGFPSLRQQWDEDWLKVKELQAGRELDHLRRRKALKERLEELDKERAAAAPKPDAPKPGGDAPAGVDPPSATTVIDDPPARPEPGKMATGVGGEMYTVVGVDGDTAEVVPHGAPAGSSTRVPVTTLTPLTPEQQANYTARAAAADADARTTRWPLPVVDNGNGNGTAPAATPVPVGRPRVIRPDRDAEEYARVRNDLINDGVPEAEANADYFIRHPDGNVDAVHRPTPSPSPGPRAGNPPTGGTDMASTARTTGEGGETPYDAAIASFQAHGVASAANSASLEQLQATLAAHDFDRDPQLMAHIARMQELQRMLAAEANAAQGTITANHGGGKEYHGTGQDAAATGFRSS